MQNGHVREYAQRKRATVRHWNTWIVRTGFARLTVEKRSAIVAPARVTRPGAIAPWPWNDRVRFAIASRYLEHPCVDRQSFLRFAASVTPSAGGWDNSRWPITGATESGRQPTLTYPNPTQGQACTFFETVYDPSSGRPAFAKEPGIRSGRAATLRYKKKKNNLDYSRLPRNVRFGRNFDAMKCLLFEFDSCSQQKKSVVQVFVQQFLSDFLRFGTVKKFLKSLLFRTRY